jgi:hypothetical protein
MVVSHRIHTEAMSLDVTFVRKWYVHIFQMHSWETFLGNFSKNGNSVPIFDQRNYFTSRSLTVLSK